MKALAGFFTVVALGAGCAAMIPHATLSHAERSGVPLETLEQGRGLFVGHCGNCHLAPDPGSLSAEQWAQILPEMLDDAHLSPEQATEVLAYLRALSAKAAQPMATTRAPRSSLQGGGG